MGEHPSPGPAVAACAEAERIEELEPEAEELLPAAPEDPCLKPVSVFLLDCVGFPSSVLRRW